MSASESDAGTCVDVLRSLTHGEFRAGLLHAQQRRDESAATFDEYQKWFARLAPYLEREPGLTVDEALARYRSDCVAGRPPDAARD